MVIYAYFFTNVASRWYAVLEKRPPWVGRGAEGDAENVRSFCAFSLTFIVSSHLCVSSPQSWCSERPLGKTSVIINHGLWLGKDPVVRVQLRVCGQMNGDRRWPDVVPKAFSSPGLSCSDLPHQFFHHQHLHRLHYWTTRRRTCSCSCSFWTNLVFLRRTVKNMMIQLVHIFTTDNLYDDSDGKSDVEDEYEYENRILPACKWRVQLMIKICCACPEPRLYILMLSFCIMFHSASRYIDQP